MAVPCFPQAFLQGAHSLQCSATGLTSQTRKGALLLQPTQQWITHPGLACTTGGRRGWEQRAGVGFCAWDVDLPFKLSSIPASLSLDKAKHQQRCAHAVHRMEVSLCYMTLTVIAPAAHRTPDHQTFDVHAGVA